MLEPMHLHEGSWPWAPDKCPADQDIISLIEKTHSVNVLHVGTGGHHKVGLFCASRNIECLGLTISIDEMQDYFSLIKKSDYSLARYYKVMLANIHQVHPVTLPLYSLITLPHLGESPESLKQGISIEETLMRLRSHARRFAFYTGSVAWQRVKDIVAQDFASSPLWSSYEFKSLLVYQRTKGSYFNGIKI